MTDSSSSSSGGGCGCISLVAFIFLCAALIDSCGIATPWGKLHLDIFPTPGVRIEEAERNFDR